MGAAVPRKAKAFLERFWKELLVVVPLVVGITALLAYIGIGPDPPPPATGGAVKVTGMVKNRTLREHLEDVGRPADGYTETELDRIGNVFDVSVAIKGYKGREIPLEWTMRDAIADDELPEPEFNEQVADRLVPRSADDGGTTRVWAPIPGYAGTFEIELLLIAPDNSVLARGRSPEFQSTPPAPGV